MERLIATLRERLSDAVRVGQAQRQDGDRRPDSPLIADASVDIPEVDALGIFTTADAESAVYWEQPSRAQAFVGLGSALSITPTGADRFTHLARQWSDIAESAVGPADEDAPSLFGVGAFAFDAERPSDSVWDGFPRNVWTAPSVVVRRIDDRCMLQAQIAVPASREPAPLDDLTALLRTASATDGIGDATEDVSGRPDLRLRDPESRSWWDASVGGVLDRIERGDLDKLVLARRIEARADGPLSVGAILAGLRARFPQATIFAFRRGARCFLGATPERLVSLCGRRVSTSAVAGTSWNGAREAVGSAAFLADPKERREHAYVVDALRDALAPLCRSLEIPAEPEVLSLPTLDHLHTPVSGELCETSTVLDLVDRLHPTPAVCGVPLAQSLSLLRQYEPFDRGWYAGPIGWMDGNGDGEFMVALRSAVVDGERAFLFGGCGLVSGSNSAREWDESQRKMEAVLCALRTE